MISHEPFYVDVYPAPISIRYAAINARIVYISDHLRRVCGLDAAETFLCRFLRCANAAAIEQLCAETEAMLEDAKVEAVL
jgi:hypothetical protein